MAAAAAEYELWHEHSGAAGSDAAAGPQEEPVRCPVCRVRRLLCHRGVVCCACGGLRLDLSAEGGGLPHVAAALAAAWDAHAARGCAAHPRFMQRHAFGTHGLWAQCDNCGALFAVL